MILQNIHFFNKFKHQKIGEQLNKKIKADDAIEQLIKNKNPLVSKPGLWKIVEKVTSDNSESDDDDQSERSERSEQEIAPPA